MGKSEKKRGGKGSEGLIVPNDPASISYVRGILARGEAAKADAHGKLPFGKTHAIVGETADGLPILTLLWQIFIGTGFPNHFFCDSWVVGFWRADHEEHIIGLGSRACAVVEAVSRPLRAQGAAAHVPGFRDGVDWTRRSQECSANGGAAFTWRL